MTRNSSFELALAAMLACVLASPAWANRYRITDLQGDQWVTGVNDFGAITEGNGGYPKVYRHGSWHTLPGAPGGGDAMAVNNLGQVAGWAAVGSDNNWVIEAVVWQRDMTKTELQVPVPGWSGYPRAISDTGFVAGYIADNGYDPPHCVLWTPRERFINIGGDEGHYCEAKGVDDFGRVVGEITLADGTVHGFLWNAGRMRDLGTLGGSSSTADAINLRGQVVGTALTEGNERHAFLWHDGKMTDIGNSQVFTVSGAHAINARGEIVGDATRPDVGDQEAVRFDKGQIVRLADEVENLDNWTLWSAQGINDKGVIIGGGVRTGDYLLHFFKLTPID